jgi:hypothetical protein
LPAVPQTKPAWTNGVDALDSTNLHAYLRDPFRFLMRRPAALLRRVTPQTIPNNTWTSLTWTVEDLDDDPDGVGGHSTTTAPSRYTARYSGWYLCSGNVVWAASTVGRRQARWSKNGAPVDGSEFILPPTSAAEGGGLLRTMPIYLAEGDYLEAQVSQNSGGNLDVSAVNSVVTPTLSIVWERLAAA